jgi:hypothetical protein
LLRRERRALGRHAHVVDQSGHKMYQRTLGAVLGLDGRCVRLASLEGAVPIVETESAFLFGCTVTLSGRR